MVQCLDWAVKRGIVQFYAPNEEPLLDRMFSINTILYNLNGYKLMLTRVKMTTEINNYSRSKNWPDTSKFIEPPFAVGSKKVNSLSLSWVKIPMPATGPLEKEVTAFLNQRATRLTAQNQTQASVILKEKNPPMPKENEPSLSFEETAEFIHNFLIDSAVSAGLSAESTHKLTPIYVPINISSGMKKNALFRPGELARC